MSVLARHRFWRRAAKSGPTGAIVVALSLFIATLVIFPTGTTLTYKATYAISESQRVTDTVQHNYPGLLSMAGIGSRFLYALLIGSIIGIPSGIVLGLVARTRRTESFGIAGLAFGSLLEYNLECLLVIMLNAHRSWGSGPFSSYELPLVGFQVDCLFPIEVFLNIQSAVLLHVFKPLGITGIYLLYVVPLAIALVGVFVAGKWEKSVKRDRPSNNGMQATAL